MTKRYFGKRIFFQRKFFFKKLQISQDIYNKFTLNVSGSLCKRYRMQQSRLNMKVFLLLYELSPPEENFLNKCVRILDIIQVSIYLFIHIFLFGNSKLFATTLEDFSSKEKTEW